MFNRLSSTLRPIIALPLLLFTAAALAQTDFQTGTVDGTIGGAAYHAFTYASEVPENAGQGMEEGAVKDMLLNLAGTTQHSATFNLMEPVTMGSIELMPATIFVTILTRTENPEDREVGRIEINFSLDPESLEMGNEADITVKYHPGEPSFSEYYALTTGSLQIDSIELVDSQTMAITGTVTGQFSWQEGYQIEHNPANMLDAELTFTIDQVASSGTALELIMGQ